MTKNGVKEKEREKKRCKRVRYQMKNNALPTMLYGNAICRNDASNRYSVILPTG